MGVDGDVTGNYHCVGRYRYFPITDIKGSRLLACRFCDWYWSVQADRLVLGSFQLVIVVCEFKTLLAAYQYCEAALESRESFVVTTIR